jgi:hypothetical protein
MEILKTLIEKGADVRATTKYGDTALGLAKECKFPELTAYLRNKRSK